MTTSSVRPAPLNDLQQVPGGTAVALAASSANTEFAPTMKRDSMPKRRQPKEPQEPIGIVISGGPHEEPTPRLSAYVYSDEDETSGEPIVMT